MSESSPVPHVAPLTLDELSDEERALMEGARELMGFLSNDALTMARVPGLLQALWALVDVAFRAGELDPETRRLVSIMSSEAAGCRYCSAHTRFGALRQGISESKLESLWDYPDSDQFSEAERAALDVARLASLTPNQVEDRHMDRLKQYFNDRQVAEMVTTIALFGFLNRWNDTLKTHIEDEPAAAQDAS